MPRVVVAACWLIAGCSPPTDTKNTARVADFDFYLLALTLHAAFCADGHETECDAAPSQRPPLVIHGLWPEARRSGAYPRDCPAPSLDLEPRIRAQLAPWMPGMQSGLHEHEWRKHGGCSGLGDDAYFRHALERAIAIDAALGAHLAASAGRRIGARELRAVADAHAPGLGVTFTLHCRVPRNAPADRRGAPHLIELRQCIDDDGPAGAPGKLLDCASLGRRDQGCGESFWIVAQVTK